MLPRVTTARVTVRTVTGVRIGDARLVWQDWAVPAVLLVGAQAELWFGWVTVTGPRLLFGAVSLVAAAALLARRHHPLLALVAVSTALLLPSLFGWFAQSFWQVLMLVVGVFAAGRYAAPWKALGALGAHHGSDRRRVRGGPQHRPGLVVGLVAQRGVDLRLGRRLPTRVPAASASCDRGGGAGPGGSRGGAAAGSPGTCTTCCRTACP